MARCCVRTGHYLLRTDLSLLALATAFSKLDMHRDQAHAQIAVLTGISRTAVTHPQPTLSRNASTGKSRLAMSDPEICYGLLLPEVRTGDLDIHWTADLLQAWKKTDPVRAKLAAPDAPAPVPLLARELRLLEWHGRNSIRPKSETGGGRLILGFWGNGSLTHLPGMSPEAPDTNETDPNSGR